MVGDVMDHTALTQEARLVPPLARRMFASANGSRAIRASGTLLYCDLVGFSRRGARAIAQSERGAETLRAEINATFETVAGTIAAHGGSILYYAGDAVAAFWPDEQGSAPAAHAAQTAGRAVQRAVAAADPSQAMRAGVTSGEVWLLDVEVASAGRVPVFCGPALRELGALESPAEGVALGPGTARHDGDAAPVTAGRVPLDDPGRWIRRHHRDGFAQGADWLAEFRQAWVLFARLNIANGADSPEALTARICVAVDALEAEGGTLLQVCEDDKGLVIIGAWGLASSAWENGAERAALAARAVAATGATAAVAGGKVFSGLVGGEDYQQYAVVGDAINRAAAMCMAAVEPVTLDAETAESAARRFETQTVGEATFKGQDGAAPIYGLRAERLRGIAHAGALVGRTAERETLSAFSDRIARGERADAALVADAGLGKSRLAAWLADIWRRPGR